MAKARQTLLLILAFAGFVYAAIRLWPYTLDDAYISMQYARQWLAGHGLVFVEGQRVEGFSNPLWVFLLAIGGGLGVPLPALAKSLGLLSGCVTLVFLWYLVVQLTTGAQPPSKGAKKHSKKKSADPTHDGSRSWQPAAGLGVLLVAIHPGVGYYATAGLETTLYSMLLTVGLGSYCLSLRDDLSARWRAVAFGALALAAITRPEGPLFLLLALAHMLWHNAHRSEDDAPLAQRLVAAARANAPLFGALLVPLSYLIFRLAYYGSWLPNTYYAKPGMFLSKPALGWNYLKGFLSYHWAAPPQWQGPPALLFQIIALAFASALVWLLVKSLWRIPAARLLGLFVLAQLAFVMYASGDWMTQHRLIQPIVPLLYGLVAMGLATVAAAQRKWLLPLLAVCVISHGQHALHFWRTLDANQQLDHAHDSRNNIKAARWLAKHTKPGASLVTDEIGALGFYTKLKIIDQWGLVDGPIAQILHKLRFNPNISGKATDLRAQAQHQIVQEIMRRNPDYVMIDYRGKLAKDGTFDPGYINGLTMPQLYQAIKGKYTFVRGFPLMAGTRRHKAFLLFRRSSS